MFAFVNAALRKVIRISGYTKLNSSGLFLRQNFFMKS